VELEAKLKTVRTLCEELNRRKQEEQRRSVSSFESLKEANARYTSNSEYYKREFQAIEDRAFQLAEKYEDHHTEEMFRIKVETQ
jgi:hypothetical protein